MEMTVPAAEDPVASRVSEVPRALRDDVLWTSRAFRLALHCADSGWDDVARLQSDRRTRALGDQLLRGLGSIPANLAEGYSRVSPAERAQFLRYAFGSARECRVWYYLARRALNAERVATRLDELTEIIRLLLASLRRESQRSLINRRSATGRRRA
jgi:four helix bundle protein